MATAALATLVASFALTGAMRVFSLTYGVLDIPNERSSHQAPIPRGGGVAIVLTTTAVLGVFVWLGTLEIQLFLALCVGGAAVAFVGILDDRLSIAAGVRLAVHVAAALWAVALLGGVPSLRVGAHIVHLGWAGHGLAVLGIAWILNLFNFMDGIDGIAASEAVFVACSGAGLTLLGVGSSDVRAAGLILGAACCGFLFWNWPPAKIFMGDVGSGYVGYVIAVLALDAARNNPTALWVWLILGGVFFVDATVTLVRRVLRGEQIHEAHRSHAYQWLARRWMSHRRVTITTVLLNLFWLLPWAAYAALRPKRAAWMVIIALAPLVILAVVAGSGRRESLKPSGSVSSRPQLAD